jgi:mRNA interferase MazF
MPLSDGNVPEAGDVLWINFGNPVGREQAGRRPAVVLTSKAYNVKSSVLVVCPITRTRRDWPFMVSLPPIGPIVGFVLVDQIKVIDPAARALSRAGRVPEQVLDEIRGRLASLLGISITG